MQAHEDESTTPRGGRSDARVHSRAGVGLVIVGGSLFVVSWVFGIGTFFMPIPTHDAGVGVWIVLVPGVLGVGGFALAIVGLVLMLTARARRREV